MVMVSNCDHDVDTWCCIESQSNLTDCLNCEKLRSQRPKKTMILLEVIYLFFFLSKASFKYFSLFYGEREQNTVSFRFVTELIRCLFYFMMIYIWSFQLHMKNHVFSANCCFWLDLYSIYWTIVLILKQYI